MPGYKLFTPGPVEVSERVLQAQARPMITHRGPEFQRLLARVVEGLAELGGAEEALVMPGSGTTAVDAMLWSFVETGARVLVLVYGDFGRRIAESLRERGAVVETLASERPGEYPDPEHVAARLEEGGYEYLVLVQNETSMGLVYSGLSVLAEKAYEMGVKVLVDAVSAFPVEDPLLRKGVYAAATCSHKALAAPPGAAIVLLGREAGEYLEKGKSRNTPPALDLRRYHRFLVERKETPFTPPVTILYALNEALNMVKEEGLARYREKHRERATLLYTNLPQLGFDAVVRDPAYRSITVTAFKTPREVKATRLVAELRARGYVIAPGMKEYRDTMIRVGVMGAITFSDVRELIEAIGEVVDKIGSM